MEFKYVRIQGRELSYVTKSPKGIFAMCWRMIYDGVMEEHVAKAFEAINQWFVEHLPEPAACQSGDRPVIAYFKTATTAHMLERIEPAMRLLEKYEHPYDVVYTNFVGRIIYEDAYQVVTEV